MVYPASNLSQENILRDVHDPDSQSLRTTALAVIDTVVVDVNYENDSVAVGDPNTNTTLKINLDGSIDSNVEIDAADGDNIAISDGVDIMAVNADGSINTVDSNLINGTQKTQIVDGSGNTISSQASGSQRALDVGINVAGVQIDPRVGFPGDITLSSFTATNTSQIALAANSNRKYLIIHNPTSNTIWINFGNTATNTPPSIELRANDTFIMDGVFISKQDIHVIRNATVNVTFSIGEGL